MNDDQLETLNTIQEVLRMLTLALCATNPAAMPKVAHALRAAEADPRVSPMAATMLGDLAKGLELFEPQERQH